LYVGSLMFHQSLADGGVCLCAVSDLTPERWQEEGSGRQAAGLQGPGLEESPKTKRM
jgi:hypothetical protein